MSRALERGEVKINDTNFSVFSIEVIFVSLGGMMWSREKM